MTEFVVKARLVADATELKSGVGQGKAAIDSLGDGLKRMTAEEFKAAGGAEGLTKAWQKQQGVGKQTAASIDEVGRAARRTQMGTQQLGLQINDFATQVALGGRPMQAFAAQAGQMGWAMSQMGGTAGKVGGFLAGPWGAALVLGSTFLGGFIAKLFSAKEGAEGLTEALKKDARETDLANRAKDAFGRTLEGVTAAAREHEKALDKLRNAGRSAAKQTAIDMQVQILRIENLKAEAEAEIALARAMMESNRIRASRGGAQQQDMAAASYLRSADNLNAAEASLANIDNQLTAAQARYREALSFLSVEIGKELSTQEGRINANFDRQIEAARKRLLAEKATSAEIQRQTKLLNEQRATALENARRRPTGPSLPKVTPSEAGALLKEAFGGGTITSTTGGKHARNSYHYAAQAVDFVPKGGMGALPGNWREVIQRTAAESGLKIVELLGPGNKDHSDHVHMAFGKQRLGPDQVAAQSSQAAERAEREAEERRRAAEQLASFGTNAGQAIAGLSARFSPGATLIEQSRAALSQLDELLKEIETRKPPNMKELLADADEARTAIIDGVQQPFRDFVRDQQQSLQISRLINAGREDEAELIQEIARLEAISGTLSKEQVAVIRAGIQARKAEQREAEIAREKQQVFLDAVQSTRDAVRGLFDFSGQGIKDFPKRIAATFEKLFGDLMFEKIFGKFFRQMEDQVKGVSIVEDASNKFDAAIGVANNALDDLTAAARGAAGALGGTATTGGGGSASDSFGSAMASFIKSLPGGQGSVTGGANGTDIVVTAKRSVKVAVPGLEGKFGDILKGMGGAAVGMAANVIQQMFGGVGQMAGQVKGGKISDMLGGLAQTAAQFFPPLAIGMAVTSGLSKVLGVKNFAGGAFGIVGNLVASVLGFGKKKAPEGSATITSADGRANYAGSSAYSGASTGAAGSVQAGLKQIAETLGGTLGKFAVSIGVNDGEWRVDTKGMGHNEWKTAGVKDFNEDEAGAIAYAIADAIKDGAITGLSAAVQKALKSSPDIDKAIQEAAKTQEVEQLIKGLRGQLEKQFRDFENVAKERMRVARRYGLDVVKLEKINAEERLKVFNDILQSRTGSLKELLDDLAFGDLFEGSTLDRLARLRSELNQAATDAAAGIEGATDRQAQLSRDLVDLSREAYGTAGGEFAADLAAARSGAERTIQLERERVQAAADAARQTNAALNENNNQNAQLIAGQNRTNALLEAIAARGGILGMALGIASPAYDVQRIPVYTREPLF